MKGENIKQKASVRELLAATRFCPLIGGDGVVEMTLEGFRTACLKTRKKRFSGWVEHGKFSVEMNPCVGCERGEMIESGKEFTTPVGIKFVDLDVLMSRRFATICDAKKAPLSRHRCGIDPKKCKNASQMRLKCVSNASRKSPIDSRSSYWITYGLRLNGGSPCV